MRRFIRTRLLLHLLVLGAAALLGSCDSGDIIDTHYTVNSKGHNVKLPACTGWPRCPPATRWHWPDSRKEAIMP